MGVKMLKNSNNKKLIEKRVHFLKKIEPLLSKKKPNLSLVDVRPNLRR